MSRPSPLSQIDFTAISVLTMGQNSRVSRGNPGSASSGEVIGVACVRIRDLQVADSLQFLVNPDSPLPEEFTQRTGIYASMLADLPKLEDILPELAAFVGRDVIVWAPASSKTTEVHRYFKLTQARDRQFFLQTLAEKALPQLSRHTLSSLANHFELSPFGMKTGTAFSAPESAQLTAQLWIRLLRHLSESEQISTLNDLLNFCPATNVRTFRTRDQLAFDREKLRHYPTQPGVYFMKNRLGEILYIGKAKNLRNRLRSYFQKQSRLPSKIAAMMKQVAHINVTVVGSELEALLLESRLIKEHLPFFNKKIKDFKRMLFLKVSVGQAFPRICDASETDDPAAAYFGPFAGKSVMRYKMEILNRVFKLRECNDKTFAEHQKSPCMQFHLGFCSGPCAGLINQADYQAGVQDFLNYLEQKPSLAIDGLIAKRDAYIEDLQFEKAAILQQQWEALERLQLQNHHLHRAITEHHCLIILPDVEPEQRRILTVLHGQPVYWDSVDADAYQQQENPALAEIVAHALDAMADPKRIPAQQSQRPTIAKAMYEESRLISQWLNHHTENEGSAVFLKDKTASQVRNELCLALSPTPTYLEHLIENEQSQDTLSDDLADLHLDDEAWQWEQEIEGG
jgi:DNA polymerase-3 subunit epsilon